MSFYLYLNSRDSDHPEGNYKLYFPINETSLAGVARFMITLHSVEFANTVYPINEYNNKLYWYQVITAAPVTAYIPEGSYTGSTLATTIASVMTAASGGYTYTVAYNTDSKKFTITMAALNTWYNLEDTNTLWEDIGFYTNTAASSLVSQHPIIISGTNYVDLVTSINTHSISSSTTASLIARIPTAVAFSEIVYYEPTSPNTIAVELPSLREIFLNLYDDRGNYYKLPKNSVFSITFKVTPL